jgi:hypothetical protein
MVVCVMIAAGLGLACLDSGARLSFHHKT